MSGGHMYRALQCVCVCVYVHMYIHASIYRFSVYMFIFMCIHIFLHVDMCFVYAPLGLNSIESMCSGIVCVCVCVCTCVNIYTHICIYIYIVINSHLCTLVNAFFVCACGARQHRR